MKPREERQKVMVKARMRSGALWHDVCIVNLSVHGLGIHRRAGCLGERPSRRIAVPRRHFYPGTIARTRGCWSSDPSARAGRAPGRTPASPRPAEQRREGSRLAGRAMEFACFALVAGAIAVTAFGTVSAALARPLSEISGALG